MWKLILGFIAFAALAMYVLTKSGGDVDMGGEKHNVDGATHAPAAAPAPASGATLPVAPSAAASS